MKKNRSKRTRPVIQKAELEKIHKAIPTQIDAALAEVITPKDLTEPALDPSRDDAVPDQITADTETPDATVLSLVVMEGSAETIENKATLEEIEAKVSPEPVADQSPESAKPAKGGIFASLSRRPQRKPDPRPPMSERTATRPEPSSGTKDLLSETIHQMGLPGTATAPEGGVKRLPRDLVPSPEEAQSIEGMIRANELEDALHEVRGYQRKYEFCLHLVVLEAILLASLERHEEAWDLTRTRLKGFDHICTALPKLRLVLARKTGRPFSDDVTLSLRNHFPSDTSANGLHAKTAMRMNRPEDALECLKDYPDLERDPEALLLASSLPMALEAAEELHLENHIRTLSRETSTPAQKSLAAFMNGNLLAAAGDYGAALGSFMIGNKALEKAAQGARTNHLAQYNLWQKSGITPEFYARHEGAGLGESFECFIVGGTRSGQSLLASLLAQNEMIAHDEGERRFILSMQDRFGSDLSAVETYLRTITPDQIRADATSVIARRVDLPRPHVITEGEDLLFWLPLISLYFPKARLIFMHREIVSHAAAWAMEAKAHETKDAYDWATIGQSIRAIDELIRFYLHVLPNPKMFIEFDDLASNPNAVIKRVETFLGVTPRQDSIDILEETAHVNETRLPSRAFLAQPDLSEAMTPYTSDIFKGYLSVPAWDAGSLLSRDRISLNTSVLDRLFGGITARLRFRQSESA